MVLLAPSVHLSLSSLTIAKKQTRPQSPAPQRSNITDHVPRAHGDLMTGHRDHDNYWLFSEASRRIGDELVREVALGVGAADLQRTPLLPPPRTRMSRCARGAAAAGPTCTGPAQVRPPRGRALVVAHAEVLFRPAHSYVSGLRGGHAGPRRARHLHTTTGSTGTREVFVHTWKMSDVELVVKRAPRPHY
jgi:hypothetical protein